MSTYLSIDLDYWGFERNSRSQCTGFINRLLFRRLPILVVRDHHQILEDVNKSGCSRIEHIDYHADLVEEPRLAERYTAYHLNTPVLNCGTWLNFVKWKNRGKVIWRYPSEHCFRSQNRGWGSCYQFVDPFKYNVSGWKKTAHRCGLDKLPWKDITRVGIAISSDYWHDEGETYEGVLPRLLGVHRRENWTWFEELECTNKFDNFYRVIRQGRS